MVLWGGGGGRLPRHVLYRFSSIKQYIIEQRTHFSPFFSLPNITQTDGTATVSLT